MTRDEIIDMAKEAGSGDMGLNVDGSDHLIGLFERFAALVAAAEREAWRNALQPVFQTRMGAEQVREAVQAAIRQRGAA